MTIPHVGAIHGGMMVVSTHPWVMLLVKPFNSFYVYEQVYTRKMTAIECLRRLGQRRQDRRKDLITYRKRLPDVFMGFSSQLSYKNWDFTSALRWSRKLYLQQHQSQRRLGWFADVRPDRILNRVIQPNIQTSTMRYLSNTLYQNASFTCGMDINISIGYTFNKVFT